MLQSPNYPLKLTIVNDVDPCPTITGLVSERTEYSGFHLPGKKETEFIWNRKGGKKIFDESQRNKLPKSFEEEETKGMGLLNKTQT